MKWTGNPDSDLFLSLMDDTETAILGQAIRHGSGGGWNAHDYVSNEGAGNHIGLFLTADQAKKAVEMSIEATGRKF